MQCAANRMCGCVADGAGCWPWQWPCVVDARSRKSGEARCNKRERQLQAGPCRDDETKGAPRITTTRSGRASW
jgi:hypothetical protein